MTGTWTTGKLAVVSAAVTLTGAAALLSLVLAAYPKSISSAELGAEWQCTRTAFFWTSCSRIGDTTAVVQSVRKDAPCPPRRGLNG